MPDVGFRDGGHEHAIDSLLQLGNALGATLIATIVVGTVQSSGLSSGSKGGTIAGAAVLISRKFSMIESVEVVSSGIQSGTLAPIEAKVIGFGRSLGTLIGTTGTLVLGSIPSATNNILVQFYVIATIGTLGTGNLPPVPIADATRITGSVVAVITGR